MFALPYRFKSTDSVKPDFFNFKFGCREPAGHRPLEDISELRIQIGCRDFRIMN